MTSDRQAILDVTSEWEKFKSHKVVRARRMVSADYLAEVQVAEVLFADGSRMRLPGEAGETLVERLPVEIPEEGGYMVVYQDGFVSWSPVEAFETGYRPVPDGGKLDGTVKDFQERENIREITSHRTGGALDEQLTCLVMDEPGDGGACHHYRVLLGDEPATDIRFQNGPVQEAGVNGLSNEVLLAIVADRLNGFQSGMFGCTENQNALRGVNEALGWLHTRTRARVKRGVEGTHQI